MIGIPYETRPSPIEEKAIRDDDPAHLTRKLAEAKAQKIGHDCPPRHSLRRMMQSPREERRFTRSRATRKKPLRGFPGSQFSFVIAIAVLHPKIRPALTVEWSDIFFRPLLDDEIEQYTNRYDVLNYAGAFENDAVLLFAIESPGATTWEQRSCRAA